MFYLSMCDLIQIKCDWAKPNRLRCWRRKKIYIKIRQRIVVAAFLFIQFLLWASSTNSIQFLFVIDVGKILLTTTTTKSAAKYVCGVCVEKKRLTNLLFLLQGFFFFWGFSIRTDHIMLNRYLIEKLMTFHCILRINRLTNPYA